MRINYPIQVSFLDYPDNNSLAICVYFCGCTHNCVGCHSKDLQNINSGEKISVRKLKKEISIFSKKNKTNKLVFFGGDPLFLKNIEGVKKFLKNNKKYDICIYTGYDKEYIIKNKVSNFEFLKCNKYDVSCKQLPEKTDVFFKLASKNQVFYDKDFNALSKDGVLKFKI